MVWLLHRDEGPQDSIGFASYLYLTVRGTLVRPSLNITSYTFLNNTIEDI